MKKPNLKTRAAQSRADVNLRKSKARIAAINIFGSFQKTWVRNRAPARRCFSAMPGPALSMAAMEFLIATPTERLRDRIERGGNPQEPVAVTGAIVRVDCETCFGEGWYWNALLREERPCIDCEGLGSHPIGNNND